MKSSFSLIELLVAIGIIAILASLIGPYLSKGQDASIQSACMSNLKSAGTEVSRLYLNSVFPDPIDPFTSNANLLSRRSFFQPVQFLPVHYPATMKPPPGGWPIGSAGSVGGQTGEVTPPETSTGESGGGSGTTSNPKTGGGTNRLSAGDFLSLMSEGCPAVEENPFRGVRDDVPDFRSYSFLDYNASVHYRQAWPWLLSESYFSSIETKDNLASKRHNGLVNVYFKDGHLEALSPDDLEFPEIEP